MQETLYHTADARDTLSASGCRSLSISPADAGDTLSASGIRHLFIIQRMQEKLYQTADAEVSL